MALHQREVDAERKAAQEKAEAEVKRAKRRIRRNWILTALVAIVAVPTAFSAVAVDQTLSLGMKVVAGPFWAVLVPYLVWATLWGVPAVWRWWRELFRRRSWILILPIFWWLFLILLYWEIPLVFGYMYGALGGGIYEYLKARKLVEQKRG